ncbi:hypothetical protein [Mucilaginibacter sp. 3215]|uniref:hypothetical protein n=1 Tax=Mucilaginibacter sp. 3215 TaxID=3373912 RepID=UPI003D1D0E81
MGLTYLAILYILPDWLYQLVLRATLNLQNNLLELVAVSNTIMAKIAYHPSTGKGQPLKRSPLSIFLVNELK